MMASYWEIGRRIAEFEKGGQKRADYREELLARLEQASQRVVSEVSHTSISDAF